MDSTIITIGKCTALWGEPERQSACNSDLYCATPNYKLWAAGCTLVAWPLSLSSTDSVATSVSYPWLLLSQGSD